MLTYVDDAPLLFMYLNLPVQYNLKFFFPVCDPSPPPKPTPALVSSTIYTKVQLHVVMLAGWFQHQTQKCLASDQAAVLDMLGVRTSWPVIGCGWLASLKY